MKAAFDAYERLAKLVSETFIVRAVIPWTFVLLLDLGVYELFIPDGRSLVSMFLGLHHDHQTYILFAVAAWILALTLFSDGVANQIIRKNRELAVPPASSAADAALPFEISSWWNHVNSMPDETARQPVVAAKIEEALTATLRNANLATGLAVSIWPVTLGLAHYQSCIIVSGTMVIALFIFTIGSFYLARRELSNLIALDGIQRRLQDSANEKPQGEKATEGSSNDRQQSHGLFTMLPASTGIPFDLVLLALFLLGPIVYLGTSRLYLETSRHRLETSRDREESDPRHLTIIAVNDIYRLEGVAGGQKGGLARLRTLRKSIESEGQDVILLHAGDFLAPSLASSVFKGKQMIDVMNLLDGNEAHRDDKMFVAFGNHEFDDSKCNDKTPTLDARVAQSQFTWLNTNLNFSNCRMLDTIGQHNVKKYAFFDVGDIKIGLFGIGLTPDRMEELGGKTLAIKTPPDYPGSEDEVLVAAQAVDDLRKNGANYVIAVTHLPRELDQELLDTLGPKGLNLIVGGHDHDCMELTAHDGSAYGFKSDSDAKTARRIDLTFHASGKVTLKSQLIELGAQYAPDVEVANRSSDWLSKAEADICKTKRKSDDPRCLDKVIGSTQASIDLDEFANRSRETGFGDWIADLVRAHTHADVAILNSGTFGLNEKLAEGSELKMRQIIDIFRYDDLIATRKFPTKTVCEALRHGFRSPGRGAWPHVSGVKIEIDDARGDRAVKVDNLDCGSDVEIKVAALPFVLCGNDGYPFDPPKTLPEGKKCEDFLKEQANEADRLSGLAEAAITQAGREGINPQTDERVRFLNRRQTTSTTCKSYISAELQYR